MAEFPNLQDRDEFPDMVGWFDPPMLLDIARQAIVSALFGQYADRRLMQAALDPTTNKELARRAELTADLPRDKEGAVWVDYVADLGDGFDSTYAIAYLLGRKSLTIDGAGELPRGQMLVMGGDQVYPAATRKEYGRRMRRPYRYAFPDDKAPDAAHPPVLLIPGNHDWYDGLTLFLALFCTSRDKKLGSWRAIQRRSYFAQALPGNWWIWGFDLQLGEDIDQPQADFFVKVARSMPQGAKIILVAPVPTWIYGELKAKDLAEREKFYRGLNYISHDIIAAECKKARVCAVLSGDTHHYSRYSAREDGTQFITAGGGGAFLHPTHQLVDDIHIGWMGQSRHLSLKTDPGKGHKPVGKEACYPPRGVSRRLLAGNGRFALTNRLFSLTLGLIYWLAAQFVMAWRSDVLVPPASIFRIAWTVLWSPAFFVAALAFGAALTLYADGKTWPERLKLGVPHALVHLAIILALVSILPPLDALFGAVTGNLWFFILFLVETVLIGGFAGAFVWGRYLWRACDRGLHTNDGFSAMRLGDYRHFLRLRITEDELIIYPLGLDKAPAREDWEVSKTGGASQNDPVVVPKQPLAPHLIEEPIVIPAR